jgi:hypothetical protein
MDILKALGVDPSLIKSIGDQYEKRLINLEQMNDYQADLLEQICSKLDIDIDNKEPEVTENDNGRTDRR